MKNQALTALTPVAYAAGVCVLAWGVGLVIFQTAYILKEYATWALN